MSSTRLFQATWPGAWSYWSYRTASRIICNILAEYVAEKYLHIDPNSSSLICIHRSDIYSHRWNLSLLKIFCLTHPDADMILGAITHGTILPPSGKRLQCIIFFLPCQKFLSLMGADLPRCTWLPPTLSLRQPLIVIEFQVFNLIGFQY